MNLAFVPTHRLHLRQMVNGKVVRTKVLAQLTADGYWTPGGLVDGRTILLVVTL